MNTRKSTIKNLPPLVFWILIVFGAVAGAVTIVVLMLQTTTSKNIDSFDSCKNAGGAILESYPERCLINGKSFVNESQVNKDNGYVGLTEQAAMDKAKTAGVPHRVVERDNESLAVTMDYVVGRLNFHVRGGEVYRVVVEGEE